MKVLQTTVITLLFMGLFSTSFADSIETMGGGIYHNENPLVLNKNLVKIKLACIFKISDIYKLVK